MDLRATEQAGFQLEEFKVLLIQDDGAGFSAQPAQDHFAGLLLDLVPLEIQPQDLLNDLLDGHRQLDRTARLRFILPDAASGQVFDDLVLQVFEGLLAHSSSSSSSSSLLRVSSSRAANLRKASGRSMTRFLMLSGTFFAIISSSSASAPSAFASFLIVSSLGNSVEAILSFSILLR